MAEESHSEGSPETIRSTDIVFECPKCGKSLVIDRQGAGLVITCPDCGDELQVPEELARKSEESVMDSERFDQIRAEIGLIQAALDRIVTILQDALAPASRPPGAERQ